MKIEGLRPGDPVRLGDYWLASKLGSGGQGVVYEAYDEAANRVAIKVLHAYLAGDSALRRRFVKEVTAAERVASFCTARVLGHDLEGERPYIVSEFVAGPSMRRAVIEGTAFTGDALHRLAVGTATALAAIHQAGVVHRDLKPENVLLGSDGPRVIDFGIARAAGLSVTSSEELVGTPMYMAPELFSGGQAEPAADVFAWGAVVFFAATGRDAFTAPSTFAVINRLLGHDPDLGILPPGLRELVRAALSKDPAARPSAQRLLLSLLGGGTLPAGGRLLADGAQAAVAVRPPEEMAAEPPLGAVAERVYAALPPTERETLRQMVLRLVDVREGEEVPRNATLGELVEGQPDPTTAERVLDTLENAALIRRDAGTVTVCNGALLRAWPRLHEWISSDRDAIDRHRRLGEAARRWAVNGRLAEDLLRGTALRDALAWSASARLTLNLTETEFLRASSARSVRQRRWRTLVTTAVAVLLVASLTAGTLAWQQSRKSDESDRRLAEQRARTVARQVALQADALRASDPAKAMLLSVAAYRVAHVPEASAAVYSSLAQQERQVFKDPVPANEGRALSVDGRTLVSAGAGKVTAYDVLTGKTIRTFTGIGEGPFSAALGPDGDTLALGKDGIHLWSLRTGRPLGDGRSTPKSYGANGGDPADMRFSPGGGYITVQENLGGPYRALWNVARRRLEIPDERRQVSEVWEATLGPGDRFGSVNAADPDTGTATTRLRSFPDGGPVESKRLPRDPKGAILAFTPDGAFAAVGEDERTRLWDLSSGRWDTREFPGAAQEVVFGADGRFMITLGSRNGGTSVLLWRLSDGAQLVELPVTFTITGPPRIGSDNRTLTLLDDSGQVTTYDISRNTQPRVLAADTVGKRFTTTADTVFAVSGGVVRSWSLPGFTETDLGIKAGTGEEYEEVGVAVTPDGRTLATVRFNDGTRGVTLWDVATRRKLRDVPLESESAEKVAVETSPDGRLLAVSSTLPNDYYGQGEVQIVDLARREQVMRFRSVAGGPLSFSSDSRTLVTGDQGGVDVIDLVTKEVLPRSKGPGTLAKGWMTLAPKGTLAASPYGRSAVTLWDTRTWRPTGQVLRLSGEVLDARFSPDGRFLAVTHDTRVTLFDVAAGQQLGSPLTVTTPQVRDGSPALAFTPDGALLRVIGHDGTFQELPLDPERAVADVCRRVGRPLTPAEWREHVGSEVPYTAVC